MKGFFLFVFAKYPSSLTSENVPLAFLLYKEILVEVQASQLPITTSCIIFAKLLISLGLT